MDEYNRLIDQYNQQAQQVINNSNAAIGNQANNVPTTSIPSGTTTTTPTNTQPTTTGNTAQQTAASMQQGVNSAQQDVNNAQQGVVNATQQAIASTTGGTGATQTQTDAWTEWNTLTAKAQNGTATPADYARAQQLYPLLFGGNTQTPTTGSTTQPASTQAGTGAGTGAGTSTGTTGTQGTGTTSQPTGTNTQTDALAEWNAIMARVQAGTATPADYSRAQELYSLVYGGTPASTSGTNQGNQNTQQSQSGMTTDQAWAEFRRLIALGTPDAYIQAMALYNSGALNGVPGYTGTTTPGSGTGANTGTPATYPSGNPVVPGVTTEYSPVQMDNIQRINDMYDAQINAERIALQEQGDQALSDAQANRDKIADTYAKQRNAASVDWERQRRNFLEGAMTSGLNTGAGSQAELSMMGMYQRGQNTLGASQAQAEAEADRNLADIKRSTQASINEAVMKNDYQKAAALLDEYKDQYNRAMDRAEALASFGDFSGYAAIYGNEVASNMFRTWAMQNPELALSLGLITQQQFAQGYLGNLYKSYPALALYANGYGGSSADAYASLMNQYSAIANNPNTTPAQAAQTLTEYDSFRNTYG